MPSLETVTEREPIWSEENWRSWCWIERGGKGEREERKGVGVEGERGEEGEGGKEGERRAEVERERERIHISVRF